MARKKKAAAKENAERWLLTYADLITLLMVFFVMLFAMSKTDAAKFKALAQSLHAALSPSIFQSSSQPVSTADSGAPNSIIEQDFYAQVQRTLQQVVQQQQLSPSQISVQTTPEGVSITFSGSLLFYNGTDQIKPDGITVLQAVSTQLGTLPNKVRIEGHTDDIPATNSIYPTNWELSSARAVAVVRYLTDTTHLAPNRFSAVGYGQYQPIVPNDSREHREANRRAVIVILFGSGTQK